LPEPSVLATFQSAVTLELLFTFALASVVIHATTSKLTEGNSYFGAAIGLVIMTGVFAGGLSGGVYNPALAIGAYLTDFSQFASHLPNLQIYLIGPLGGGILAGLLYRIMNLEENPKSTKKHKRSK